MKDIRIYSLFSGSSGNCHYVKLGEQEILIDAGKNAKAIVESLTSIGTDISNISSIYITHEHADHIAALRVLQKKNKSMRLCAHPLCAQGIAESGADVSEVTEMTADGCLCDGKLRIKAFSVPHDSRACLGYRIEYGAFGCGLRVGVATDIGHLTCEVAEGLIGCDAVIVESNHDVQMLRCGPYPQYLKERIFSANGHLSNESCAKLCAYLSKNGATHFMLAHVSKENNTRQLAMHLTAEAVAESNARVTAALPNEPVCLYES